MIYCARGGSRYRRIANIGVQKHVQTQFVIGTGQVTIIAAGGGDPKNGNLATRDEHSRTH